MSYIVDNKIDIEDGPRLSDFGNLRVVQDLTLFASTMQNEELDEVWDTQLAGSGSTTFNEFESSLSLNVTAAAGDMVTRRTFRYFQYQPGNTTKLDLSANFGADESGVVKRVGYFDNFDGVFVEKDGSQLSVVIRRTLSSGNTQEEQVTQANFNIDTMDGTGPSEINLDTTKLNLFRIDFAWHGVGRVRIGTLIGGSIIYFHQFDNSNVSALPFMGKADLPISYEIENVDGTNSGEMKQFSNSIKIEGGESTRGFSRCVTMDAGQTFLVPKVGDEWYNLITIRIKDGNRRVSIALLDLAILNISDKAFQFAIFKNADTTGLTFTDVTDYIETAITQDHSFTDGVKVSGGTGTRLGAITFNLVQVRDRINGIEGGPNETFTVGVRRVSDSAEVSGVLNFIEFR